MSVTRGGVRVGVANTLPGASRGIILGAWPRVRVLRADGQIVVEQLFAFTPELTGACTSGDLNRPDAVGGRREVDGRLDWQLFRRRIATQTLM